MCKKVILKPDKYNIDMLFLAILDNALNPHSWFENGIYKFENQINKSHLN